MKAFLFPGQGAQYPGMAKDLWESSPEVKDLFALASEATSMDLRRLLFEGSEEELKATDNTQVAVTLASVAASHSGSDDWASAWGTSPASSASRPKSADRMEADIFFLVVDMSPLSFSMNIMVSC